MRGMNDKCSVCGYEQIDTPSGYRPPTFNGCCSPECVRTKTIVDALDRLTAMLAPFMVATESTGPTYVYRPSWADIEKRAGE